MAEAMHLIYIPCILIVLIHFGYNTVYCSAAAPAPPRLRENAPNYFEVPYGEDVKLRCAVSGIPKPFVEWFKNNLSEPISSSLDRIKIMRNSLTIENVTYSDTDSYYCKASNDHGTIWKNFSVIVIEKELDFDTQADDNMSRNRAFFKPGEKYPPFFTQTNKMQKLIARIAGSSLVLRCPAKGNPEPKIEWLKDGNVLDLKKDAHIVSRKWSLLIDHLLEMDSGTYECVVSNDEGAVRYSYLVDVQERVPHKPLFEDGFPSNLTAYVGGKARLECKFVSDLQPRMRWVRHLNTSDNSDAPHIEALEDPNQTDPHILVISNLTLEDEGWYTCLAGNALGISFKSAYLTVLPGPEETEKKYLPLSQNTGGPSEVVLIVIICVCAFMVFAVIIACSVLRIKKNEAKVARKEGPVTITKKVILERDVNNANSIVPFVKIDCTNVQYQPEYILPSDPRFEFPRERLVLQNILGEGAFGLVYKAEAFGLNGADGPVTVAVKTLKDAHNDVEMAILVTELELMKTIGTHRNVISFQGCCTKDGPLYIILEYAERGNLRDYLRAHRPPSNYHHMNGVFAVENEEYVLPNNVNPNPSLTLKQLVSFARQVSIGMTFLTSKKCVHRDLAARNVLLTSDDVIKIADFGLARDIQASDYYKKRTRGRLPVKWMALEALSERVYSTASDVWSFGVLLWEIMTLGSTPYAEIPCGDLYQTLKDGHRLAKPENCPMEIYLLMCECWQEHPQDRPTFAAASNVLDRILLNSLGECAYLELDFPVLDTPENSSSGDEI